MPVAVWPAGVPFKFLNGSFAETLPDNLLRTSMETGPAKTRRRTTSGVRELDGELLISGAERSTFESFYTTDLRSGSLPFTASHPRTGTSLLLRFREPPAYADFPTATTAYYTLAVKLEVLP